MLYSCELVSLKVENMNRKTLVRFPMATGLLSFSTLPRATEHI